MSDGAPFARCQSSISRLHPVADRQQRAVARREVAHDGGEAAPRRPPRRSPVPGSASVSTKSASTSATVEPRPCHPLHSIAPTLRCPCRRAGSRSPSAARQRRPARELTHRRTGGSFSPIELGLLSRCRISPELSAPRARQGGTMRFATLSAALVARLRAVLRRGRARAERAEPRLRRHQRRALAVRARRPRDLDVRHRLQRPLLHLHLPAAPRRRDRLVRDPRRRPPRRPVRGLGRDPRPRLLRARRSGLPGALGRPRPTASSGARATTTLLSFVGREGYRDPACDFEDAPFDTSTPHGAADQRQSACDLRFGTSTGRARPAQVPQPALRPRRLGADRRLGGLRRASCPTIPTSPDSRLNRLWDGSVEPPFRIGMACGACHIAYDPLNPPADPNHPAWENIDALVGNQYSRISNLLGSGLSPHRLEWQLIARARPGIVDTSALPMDFVSNPGTMNAIINFARRPLHEHEVLKWRKAVGLRGRRRPDAPAGASRAARASAGSAATQTEMVPHILKGGEDSIGYNEAIQRVYFNIGSCAEQCWINHLTDLRAADPEQRNYGQTPFDIGQCRRDCGALPRHRGPARRHPRLLPDRAPDRPLAGPRPRLAARPRGRARRRVLRRRRRARPRGLRRQLRPLPFEPAGALRRPSTSARPTRTTRRCGSTGSATTRWCRPPRSAPTRRARCTRTTCRAGSGREYASLDRARAAGRPAAARR